MLHTREMRNMAQDAQMRGSPAALIMTAWPTCEPLPFLGETGKPGDPAIVGTLTAQFVG